MSHPTASTPLLDIRNMDVAYGGIRAVRQLNLHVHPGERVALIGANGAGKSTTLRAICGPDPLAAGSAHYPGHSLAGQPVHAMVRQGLVMVTEGRGIFPQLTIEENLHMGAYSRQDKINFAQELQQVYQRFPRLAERRLQTAGTLSGGEQQLLAMGRAILSKPKLLLLDEPTMGLAPIMVDKIFEVIEDIAQQGVTILLIEQNARLALEVSQRGYVLESGELTLQGPARDLLHDPKVRAAYLGE